MDGCDGNRHFGGQNNPSNQPLTHSTTNATPKSLPCLRYARYTSKDLGVVARKENKRGDMRRRE